MENQVHLTSRSFTNAPRYPKSSCRFLEEIQKQFPALHRSGYGWTQYAFAIIAGIIILNGGAVIYADTTDVSTSHPLYSYKLLAEEVRVKTASPEKQPEIEVQIAERRIKELRQLTLSEHPTNSSFTNMSSSTKPIIVRPVSVQKTQKQLRDNFKYRIESVELNIDKESATKRASKKAMVCKELSTINNDVVELFENEDDTRIVKEKISHICSSDSEQTQIERIKSHGRDKNRD
jgi:hypothetical protein